MVSASTDKTLKVWDLVTGACLLTHRGSAAYCAVAAATTAIVAGDATGSVWLLDWPWSDRRRHALRDDRRRDDPRATQHRDELLARLSGLLPSQFEAVLFLARIPAEHLAGVSAPQRTRAIDAIRYLEQQDRLEELARIVVDVAMGHGDGGPTGDAGPP